MRITTVVAILLFAIASIFLVYSMVITPRMDSGVAEQDYRRPIQDTPPSPESKKPPLVDSNVPPASEGR